ncbi:MAG TPA: hypothetical protein PKH10_05500 [bacterium]|nr:hypothetical protein [bacterium]
MKKVTLLVALTFAAIMLSGCTTAYQAISQQYLTPLPVDYEIIGTTMAESERTQVFWVEWAYLFHDEQADITNRGSFNAFLGGIIEDTKAAALYAALEKMPDADKLIEPRYKIEVTNFLIGKTVHVTVWAKAIKYLKSSPYIVSPAMAAAQ